MLFEGKGNRMKRFWSMLLSLLLLCMGCGAGDSVRGSGAGQNDAPVIGYSIDSLIIERWQREQDVFVATAAGLGATVEKRDAGGDVDRQIEQIRELIAERVSVIVVIASDCYRLSHVLNEASEAGIKVVCYDRLVQNAPVDLYVSVDSKTVGRLMAECINDRVSEDGKIVCIYGSSKDNNTKLLQEGFQEKLDKDKITVIRSDYAEDWVAEHAYDIVSDVLRSGEHIDGVVCANDDLAGQAYLALSEYQEAGKTVLIGQDAELSACQRIVEETQTMTVYKPVYDLSMMAAEYAVQLAKGTGEIPDSTIFNGKADIPSVIIEPSAVTKENLNDVVIHSGFHTAGEIYRVDKG